MGNNDMTVKQLIKSWLTGTAFFIFVIVSVVALAGNTAVNRYRLGQAEGDIKTQEAKQQRDHDIVIELKSDVKYVRDSVNKLLDKLDIARPIGVK